MGDIFKTTSSASSVTNQQVGVQGAGAVGQSGSVGGSQAAAGSIAVGDISGTVGDIRIEDLSADVAMQAINSAQNLALESLTISRDSQGRALSAAENAFSGATALAAKATPLSSGDLALALDRGDASKQTKILIAGGAVVVVVLVFYTINKRKK